MQMNEYHSISAESQHNFHIRPHFNSKTTEPIFTIFSPHESALHADDGTVLYFAIGQGTLPWQPIKSKNRPFSFVALPF